MAPSHERAHATPVDRLEATAERGPARIVGRLEPAGRCEEAGAFHRSDAQPQALVTPVPVEHCKRLAADLERRVAERDGLLGAGQRARNAA
jgi:hypothetical protein